MLRVDKVDERLADQTPLFRNPIDNSPLSYSQMLAATKHIAQTSGSNPDQFGTHSFRIGGATALFAAGASETIIRTMGRWSSDLHRLYVRACYEQCCEWSKRAGSVEVSDLAEDFDEVDHY